MHIENMKRLISHLETVPDERFNMANFCGTVCCIAGHGHELFFGEPLVSVATFGLAAFTSSVERVANELGLSRVEHKNLFGGYWVAKDLMLSEVPLSVAIAHMNGLVAAAEAK